LIRRLALWVDHRLDASSVVRPALKKAFPDHWSFLPGEIALYSFMVLLGTGIFLTLFYSPSATTVVYDGSYEPLVGAEMSAAYHSVLRLSFDIPAGMLIRQTHHWAALIFVAATVGHLMRVFFTGAYRRPRELNWMVGVTLLGLALVTGFAGYTLPDDLLAASGLRIAQSSMLSIPLVGEPGMFLLFGGEFGREQIIPRLFVGHVLLIPALIVALVGLHMSMLLRQKHTQFPRPGRTERNVVGFRLWPTYAAKSIGLSMLVAAMLLILGGLFEINPIWMRGPFDGYRASSPIHPDWYMLWISGAQRIVPPWEPVIFGYLVPNLFFPAVLLPALTFGLLYAWPFLEARVRGDTGPHHLLDRPRENPVRTAIGVGAVTFYSMLLISGINDKIARALVAEVETVNTVLRITVLALPVLAGLVAWRWCSALRDSGG
jgi:ubiquinol-cytochrome c reductase cytochrome b subunit